MGFYDVLDQVLELLCQRSRVTYRALKREFHLDDEALEDLKEELLFAHPVGDQDGRGLVWTGDPVVPEPDSQRGADAESRFYELILTMIGLFQREPRITYRRLKHVFCLDDVLLEDVRKELLFTRMARDEQGEGLVWTGDTPPVTPLEADVSSPSDTVETTAVSSPVPTTLPPHIPETHAPSHEPISAPASLPTDAPHDELAVTMESARRVPEAEHRQLTVMFCDLADSTKLSQLLDPEDLREVVRAYQAASVAVIQQYEGHIAQYLGDGLLLYFGWPIAHEDDAQRALYSGLGIVNAITSSLNPRLYQEKGVQLTVRLGIHTGPVVVGEMGSGGRHENLATGETVNIAARLEGLAAPNTVVISQVTARLVRDAFVLESLGPHALRGVAEPMPVFRVDGVRQSDAEDSGRGGFEALVGRDEEIGLLLRRWEQSKEGLGHVVLISGEAGIGKSSLVEGLRQHVRQEGYTRIAFRCSEYVQQSALYPVVEHLHRVLDWQHSDNPHIRLAKLEQVLQPSSLPLDEAVPLLATLLSLPLPEDRYPALSLSPQQQRQQTQDVLVAWLLEEAERQPVLVVWEDLHWADPSTLELLRLFIDQVPTVSMLHILVYRPAFVSPWPLQSHMTPLTLHRLERPQVEAMIRRLAGGKALPPEVVAHIVAKTDGVPLYVEELTKMLLESALLQEEAEQYTLRGPLVEAAIPATLHDSLMARLDRLPTVREVAQLGAVLGREFAYEMLQALTAVEELTLQEGLSQLVDNELLYQRGRPPRAKYIFRHALIRDTAYQSLLRRTRQQYHRQVAQLLEARFPEVVETQPELVAHHFTEAGLTEQAVAYWQRAGQRAVQRAADLEATQHFVKALALLTTLPREPERVRQELEVRLALGSALVASRGYTAPEVEETYLQAQALCQQLGETQQLCLVLRGLEVHYLVGAKFHTARELAEQLLCEAERQDDAALLVGASHALGQSLFFLGEQALARTHLERGMALYDPEQHQFPGWPGGRPGEQCFLYAAWSLWILGYPAQAMQKNQVALTLIEKLSHPFSRASALGFTALLHQFRRETAAAQEQAEAAMAVSTEYHIGFYLEYARIIRGWSLALQGQGAEGIAEIRQGLAAIQAPGTGVICGTNFLALLAEACGLMGYVAEGRAVLTEAMDLMDKTRERYYEAELHRLTGTLLLQQTGVDVDKAEACFHQALAIARRQEAKALELRAATSLAQLWQSQGKRKEAYDLLDPVYAWFTEGFDTADLQEAKLLLAELA